MEKNKLELLCMDKEFKAQYDAILEKHSATKDREAAMAEIAELAATKGVTLDKTNIYEVDSKGKTELSEENLEEVSGGGSRLAMCLFTFRWDIGQGSTSEPRKRGYSFESRCGAHLGIGCNWALCRCHNTEHCRDGWHECNEDCSPIRFHSDD